MTNPAAVAETIKEEQGKFVLYTKDGSRVLGRHATREKAQAQEAAIEAAKKAKGRADEGLALVVDQGTLEVVEGGRYDLREEDMGRLSDANLKKLRAQMVEKRQAKREEQAALSADERYNSTAGAAIGDDLWYYTNLINRLESEMQCRMLTLD